MKDKLFQWSKLLLDIIKNIKFIVGAVATLVTCGAAWGSYVVGAGELEEAVKSLTAEQGALKIYADMAYNCPELTTSDKNLSTIYIKLMKEINQLKVEHEH